MNEGTISTIRGPCKIRIIPILCKIIDGLRCGRKGQVEYSPPDLPTLASHWNAHRLKCSEHV